MSDIEEEVAGFESEITGVLDRAKACVQRLVTVSSDDLRYLIAERLPTLGSVISADLQAIVRDTTLSPSTRYLAAWVALEVGDRDAAIIDLLCAEVDADSSWSLPAANALARHRIEKGVGSVLRALEGIDPQDTVKLMGYVTALYELGGDLPDIVRRRIHAEGPPWIVRAIDKDFPPA